MNNKGVTLIELLIVIVVLGIISAFAIPAVGSIITNTEKDAVIADAIAVENAAKTYCGSTTCTNSQTLAWTQVSEYITSFDTTLYEQTDGDGDLGTTLATYDGTDWTVVLEANDTPAGPYEFSGVPTQSDRDDVTTP